MAEKKITQEELDNILGFQNRLYNLSTDVGILETQKHAILHELAGVNNEQEEYKKVLEEKYGKININLEDGTFEELKGRQFWEPQILLWLYSRQSIPYLQIRW